jgi:hypothetical protein
MSSSADADRQSLRFSETVAPDSEVLLTYDVPVDMTVEQLEVRIYRGAEFSLEIEPFIDRRKSEDRTRREDLITYRGSEFVAGDADKFSFDVSKSVEEGQEIGIEARNKADAYAYDFVVDLSLERAGGLSRILGGVF